jgi:predicted site-specific integrase-resolvase
MDGNKSIFVTSAEAARITSLHPHTLRKYADNDQVKYYKTPSGQRKYDRQSLEKFCNPSIVVHQNKAHPRINYLYSRVSSKKHLDDLSKQTQYLLSYRPEYSSYVSLSDIASGINFKRKGLQTILDSCLQGTIGEIVIAHRDRLCRFGFELLEILVEKSGGKITILDNDGNKSTEQELSEDLLSIVHIYSCKQMGKRSYKEKLTKIIENQTEDQSQPEKYI